MSDYVESGLVIPVPSLQEFVTHWRPSVDRVPPVGVPAHITVLYPFIPPGEVESEIGDLRRFFSGRSSFPYSLTEIDWFGNEVVYARPDPSEPFATLTDAVHERWGLPPYGGTVTDPQPHVTLGFEGEPETMQEVAEAAASLLPLDEEATEVWLLQGTPDPPMWQVTHRFDLGE